MRTISREEFVRLRAGGQLFCWATLYERQDAMLDLGKGDLCPIRNITHEPNHHHRKIGG